MTWEQTIEMIRSQEEYAELVEKAYFDANLSLNVERFGVSEEFKETLKIINKHQTNAKSILDIGCGNGISTINFSLKGYDVTAVEPDKSKTIGAEAIQLLKTHYNLDNLKIYNVFAEDINFPDNTFDVVYVRQAMHHANHLNKFIEECVRVLKPNGLLLTIRDHVIYNKKDKHWFLEMHPLHKYYGGENAYTSKEYRDAFINAGADIKEEIKYYDNVINYFPTSTSELARMKERKIKKYKSQLKRKIGLLASFPFVFNLYKLVKGINESNIFDETKVPGRMYSYIVIKK